MERTDSRPALITPRQAAFLSKLVTKHGKAAYLVAKRRAEVPETTTILKLTRWQASRLIDELQARR